MLAADPGNSPLRAPKSPQVVQNLLRERGAVQIRPNLADLGHLVARFGQSLTEFWPKAGGRETVMDGGSAHAAREELTVTVAACVRHPPYHSPYHPTAELCRFLGYSLKMAVAERRFLRETVEPAKSAARSPNLPSMAWGGHRGVSSDGGVGKCYGWGQLKLNGRSASAAAFVQAYPKAIRADSVDACAPDAVRPT